MHYVCIENELVVSILNYQPSVPDSVEVVEITDDEYQRLSEHTHYFSTESKSVVQYPAEVTSQKEQEVKNAVHREFLSSSDWKVLRHIRETALGITPSLSQEEYLALEQQRADAAGQVV